MERELIVVLDFGGQYKQLIARRVRENKVYCEIHPYTISLDKLKAMNPKGIILTGGPNSVYDEKSPKCDPALFELGVPVLGICYGCQLMAYTLGGQVGNAGERSEYGKAEVTFQTDSKLLKGISEREVCWMSHTDYVTGLPEGFRVIGTTPTCPAAATQATSSAGCSLETAIRRTSSGLRPARAMASPSRSSTER